MPFRAHGDLGHLAEVLDDFGVDESLSAEEAQRTIVARYRMLEKEYVSMAESIRTRQAEAAGLPVLLLSLCKSIHGYLYRDILINNGVYRAPDDPYAGKVYFGEPRKQRRKMKYEGGTPLRLNLVSW